MMMGVVVIIMRGVVIIMRGVMTKEVENMVMVMAVPMPGKWRWW